MKAVILAGGKGMRLRPMTSYIPKVLFPVHDRPVLDYIIDCLGASRHVDRIYIAVSDHYDTVASYVSQRHYPGSLKVEPIRVLSWETGGDLRLAIEQADIQDTFLVCNGDVYAPVSIDKFVEFYFRTADRSGISAAVLLKRLNGGDVGRHGLVDIRGDMVERFTEKPRSWANGERLVNAGYYIFGRKVLEEKDRLIPAAKTKLEETALAVLAYEGRLSGLYLNTPYWIDVGTLPAYLEAQATIGRFLPNGGAGRKQ